MAPEPDGGYSPPPDLSPQKPNESWSDYWARVHRNGNDGAHRYPWGDSEWPGADKSKDKYIYRPELVNVAKALRQDLANYTGAAQAPGGSAPKTSQQHLNDTFGVAAQEVGQWDAASTFHGTLTKTQRSMIDAHDAFVAAYQDVIARIEKAAGISQNAEDLSQTDVNGKPDNKTY
jgi:hypothetical protein